MQAETMLLQVRCEICVCRSPPFHLCSLLPSLLLSFFLSLRHILIPHYLLLCAQNYSTQQSTAEMGTQLDSLASEMGTQFNKSCSQTALNSVSVACSTGRVTQPPEGCFPHLC